MLVGPKSITIQSSSQYLLALLGSVHTKALHEMLMKYEGCFVIHSVPKIVALITVCSNTGVHAHVGHNSWHMR